MAAVLRVAGDRLVSRANRAEPFTAIFIRACPVDADARLALDKSWKPSAVLNIATVCRSPGSLIAALRASGGSFRAKNAAARHGGLQLGS